MKRALAERAKQTGETTGLSSSSPDGSQSPPLKVPRVEEPTPARHADSIPSSDTAASMNAPAPAPAVHLPSTPSAPKPEDLPSSSTDTSTVRRGSASSPRPPSSMKRQRSSQVLSGSTAGEEDDSDKSAFYLKHQNRALASELKNLQYQLQLLEKERDERRTQCRQAADALQSLDKSWTEMEASLKLAGAAQPPPSSSATDDTAAVNANDATISRSTGSGDNVELVGVLMNSLASLAKSSEEGNIKLEPDTDTSYNNMSTVASAISIRATVLQEWIKNALQNSTAPSEDDWRDRLVSLEGQIVTLQSQLKDAEHRMEELAVTKDEAVASDRRVRRGLYRLAAGRMQLPEVLKAVELDESGMAEMAAEESALPPAKGEPSAASMPAEGDGGTGVDTAHLAQVKKELQDMEEIASSRENQISQLLQERESLLKRINELSQSNRSSSEKTAVSELDIKRSALYTEATTQVATLTRQLGELQKKLDGTLEKYATAKGDTELATKTLEDHLNKFQKRWAELTGGDEEVENGNRSSTGESPDAPIAEPIAQAKRIVELEHKLKQALENVRQADTIRTSLGEAQHMNDFLHGKLEEFKAKNAALVATKSAARSTSDLSALTSSSKEKPSTPQTPLSAEKSEKLIKEHKRMRKELVAATASKENAKEKQMRAEKERDSLMKTNSRLLKQSAEKDDMNAKSLSTILHLKHMTEQLSTEKELLEQRMKSAEQLALAARLATNAKERVEEELVKEKIVLEQKVEALDQKCDSLQKAREVADGALSQTKAEMAELERSVGQARERSEELVAESTRKEEEKRKLQESLAVAQREATEASSRYGELRQSQGTSGGAGAYSGFTHDELAQLLTIIKSRVTCGVCNEREKKCILLRCRHMFCRECVDENVKNRSRKCPACGQRFDTKDVEDVWL